MVTHTGSLLPVIVMDYLDITRQLVLRLRDSADFISSQQYVAMNEQLNQLYRLMTPEERLCAKAILS